MCNRIKELFKEFAPEEVYDAWADTFEIVSVDEKQVVICYHGTEKLKRFKKECNVSLLTSIYSAVGTGKKIKITKKKNSDSLSPKAKKNIKALNFFVIGMIFVCIATAIIVVMFNYIGNRNFRETFYNASSIKIDSQIRVIQLSDLHNASYGKNNEKLLKISIQK